LHWYIYYKTYDDRNGRPKKHNLRQTDCHCTVNNYNGRRGAGHFGHKTLRRHKIDAEVSGHFGTKSLRHVGTKFKPNHRWNFVSSDLSWVRSVQTFLDPVVPKCLVAEVSGNVAYCGPT